MVSVDKVKLRYQEAVKRPVLLEKLTNYQL